MATHADNFGALEQRRRALGMSRATVARRAGLPLPTVTRVLTGMVRDPRLRTVQAIATALGVSLQLGAADDLSADQFLEQRAMEKAKRIVSHVQGTMLLEAQPVPPVELESMIRQTACEFRAGSRRNLWDD